MPPKKWGFSEFFWRADKLNQERATIQTHDIDRMQRKLSKVNEEYRNLGGNLFDQRVALEQRLNNAESDVQKNEEAQREIAAGILPLLMVHPLLKSADMRDQHEEECRRARDISEVLQSRDRAALKTLRSRPVEEETVEAIKQFFRKDRAKRRALGKETTVLDLTLKTRSDLHSLLRGGLEDAASIASRKLEEHKKRAELAAYTRAEVESIPSADTIGEVAMKRDKLKEKLAQLTAQHAALSSEIERMHREIERKEQALIRLNEAESMAISDHDDRARVLRHIEKVHGTLKTYRKAMVKRHVRRIEQLVLESYKQLLRKTSLVSRLSIDPEQFSLTLFGKDGQVLTLERLSAGEGQLLGIALLWGLAKASGRPLPTAIDTPLGRLDAGHRAHLVERYLPFASHQVLLLSTDEEITGGYLDRLKPWISKSYYLSYDDGTEKTRIVPGYFEKMEAA